MAARVAIGEFSIMTGLSRKALRHHHDLGLLEPAQVDEFTGYRYYDTSQVRTAQVIRHFRGLGMPVPEVKAMLAAPDVGRRDAVIAGHLRRMEAELGRVRATKIPGTGLAVAVHHGPDATAGVTYAALGTYVAECLLGADVPVREYYPAPDRIEICWPILGG